MPYPNGTPTPDEHARQARQLLGPEVEYEGEYRTNNADNVALWAQADATRALVHAVLALTGEVQALRESRP